MLCFPTLRLISSTTVMALQSANLFSNATAAKRCCQGNKIMPVKQIVILIRFFPFLYWYSFLGNIGYLTHTNQRNKPGILKHIKWRFLVVKNGMRCPINISYYCIYMKEIRLSVIKLIL